MLNNRDDCIEVDRALTKQSFRNFVQIAFHQIEPAREFLNNWHIDAICEHLEAVTKGDITRLVINVPPGSMKSLLACVFWPAWVWTHKPYTKWIYGSYALGISKRDNLRMRRLIESDWYQKRWGHQFAALDDNWGAIKFVNDQAGYRLATSVGGTATGEHADVQVVDDPIKPMDVSGTSAVTKTVLSTCESWWQETMASRLVDFEKSARVIIMQRLHTHDLAGIVLAEGGYEHLRLPMEYEPQACSMTSIGFKDPRIEENQLLWPERFTPNAVERLKKELGSRGAAAQLQQRPSPLAGSLFKREWIKHLKELPKITTYIQSWDCTFKDADTSDYVVGQVWAACGSQYFLLDQVRDRMSFSATIRAIEAMSMKWPQAHAKLVEAKANGPGVVDVLKDKISGLVLIEPQGGKEARANAIEPLWEAGNVFLPEPDKAPWIHDFVEELVNFGSSLHDDQVDAMSQALMRLSERSARLQIFEASMRNTGNMAQHWFPR
ncbi:MAG: phage terminase large subunit [Myxococcaceae bacterium]